MRNPRCANCGFNNPVGMRFCGSCGTELSKVSPTIPRALNETVPLHTLVGKDVKERLRQAGIDAAGQRRNVTVLFADLSNYTRVTQELADEGVFELIKRYLQVLAEDVYRYEGVVDKFTGDGLMALFGAPIAHENNAERAVRAALDMQAEVDMMRQTIMDEYGVDLQMRIGVNSGSVIVGDVGVEQMMDYTAVGDTVNLASRLENATQPGTILVSESVFRQTKALFAFKSVPDLTLKGYTAPITAYQALGVKKTPGSVRGIEGLQAQMVGRDKELKKLQKAVNTLQELKRGQFVLVIGEAGIGKSRLTTELRARTNPENVRILEGKSLTYRKSISYWIFTDLLRQYLEVSEETPETDIAQKLNLQVTELLGLDNAARILPFLERALSLSTLGRGGLSPLSELGAEQLRRQIFLAIRDVLMAEAKKKPLVIVLEDLHWADEASLELILFLLDSLREVPLMIYGITRPFHEGMLTRVLEKAKDRLPDRLTTIELHNLSTQESNQLLDQLLSIPDFPPTLLEQIIQKSSGVPFYLEEILRMLLEGHYIQKEDIHWRLVPGVDISNLGVPNTLNDLILTRFDKLELATRRVLQATSVIGREFTFPILQLTLADQLSESQLQNELEDLAQREFIVAQSGSTQPTYAFRHVLTTDAVYGTLLRQDRNMFHLRVAQAIEQLYAERLDGYVELLASHYLRSPQLDRALHYLILAGKKAASNFANEESRQHFVTALGLLPKVVYQPMQAYEIHAGMGDVLTLKGEYNAARGHYQSALEAIETDGNYIHERSDLGRKMAITFERQGDFDKALARLIAAMRLLHEDPEASPVDQARIVNDMGWIYFRRGEMDEAEMYLGLALNQVKDSQQSNLLASVYNRLGGVHFMKDRLAQASEFVRKSLEIREELGDIFEMARTYNNLGLLEWKRADWESALRSFRRSMELNRTLGDVEAMVHLQGNISLLLIDRGELEEAENYLHESLRRAEEIGSNFLKGVAYMNLSRYWLAKKEWDNALTNAKNGLDVFTTIGAQDNLIDTWWCIGEAFFGKGEMDKAQAACQTGQNLLDGRTKTLTPTQERGRILRLLGKISRETWQPGAARQYFEESANQFKMLDHQLEMARTWVDRAKLEGGEEARKLNAQARVIFERLGAGLDIAELDSIPSH